MTTKSHLIQQQFIQVARQAFWKLCHNPTQQDLEDLWQSCKNVFNAGGDAPATVAELKLPTFHKRKPESFEYPMYVSMLSINNPDFRDQSKRVRAHFVGVQNVEEAKNVVRDFIKTMELGGGNFMPAQVYEGGLHVPICYIAYNGRAWEGAFSDKNMYLKEYKG